MTVRHSIEGKANLRLVLFSEPGFIEFEETIHLVKESVGKAELKVLRVNGADGRVTVRYKTKDIDAVATKDYERKSNID
jgi:hypothetical protein